MKTFVFMFVRGLRAAFYTLDKAVFFLFESAYSLVQKIAEVNILGEGDFQDFASRVYLFLGIFMLFKVAVSLINYFINPDSFSDSKSGMGSVLKRIIISLILIVAVPFIFTEARTLQDLLIKNENGNILVNVVFGGNGSGDTQNMEEYYSNAGSTMSVKIFCSFFKAKDGDNEACLSAESISALENLIDETGADEHEFTYDYKIPLSTIAGGFAAWIMVMFCFDVAVRAVKLSFLQLISPIPVMSYIDPKKGDQIFNKWVSECVSTYLSLFLRLLALYLGIYILSRINIDSTDTFATVFIILGLLLFMKEVPKLIMDIFGIKDMGGFTLNPVKRIKSSPYAAGALGLVGGAIGGTAANLFAAGKEKDMNGNLRNPLQTAGSAIAGGISGGFRGMVGGLNGKGGAVQGITDSSRARSLRYRRNYGVKDKIADWWTSAAQVPYRSGTSSMLKDQVNRDRINAQNAAEQETQARNELRDFRSKLSAAKSETVSKILGQRRFKDRDETGLIRYTDQQGNDFDLNNYEYDTYYNSNLEQLKEIERIQKNYPENSPEWNEQQRLADEIIAGELTRTEFNDMKIRDRIVQEAERDTFNAKKAAESSQELADLAKKK